MSKLPSIFLIGPSGAGKSTVGQELASKLKLKFYDTDQVIEQRTGVSISWIYDVEGEAGFHRRQTEVLKELVEKPGIVLATGADIILSPENRNLLAARGLVIYLSVPLDQQIGRTQRKEHRPLLQVEDVESTLKEMNDERVPLYESIADIQFSTEGFSIRNVLKSIVDYLHEQGY